MIHRNPGEIERGFEEFKKTDMRYQRRDYLIKLLGRVLAVLWMAFFLWISALAVSTLWIWIFYD